LAAGELGRLEECILPIIHSSILPPQVERAALSTISAFPRSPIRRHRVLCGCGSAALRVDPLVRSVRAMLGRCGRFPGAKDRRTRTKDEDDYWWRASFGRVEERILPIIHPSTSSGAGPLRLQSPAFRVRRYAHTPIRRNRVLCGQGIRRASSFTGSTKKQIIFGTSTHSRQERLRPWYFNHRHAFRNNYLSAGYDSHRKSLRTN
jgi:hypothetical protein